MTESDQFQIQIRPRHRGGFTATVAELPGCVAVGATEDECRSNIETEIEIRLGRAVRAAVERPEVEDTQTPGALWTPPQPRRSFAWIWLTLLAILESVPICVSVAILTAINGVVASEQDPQLKELSPLITRSMTYTFLPVIVTFSFLLWVTVGAIAKIVSPHRYGRLLPYWGPIPWFVPFKGEFLWRPR